MNQIALFLSISLLLASTVWLEAQVNLPRSEYDSLVLLSVAHGKLSKDIVILNKQVDSLSKTNISLSSQIEALLKEKEHLTAEKEALSSRVAALEKAEEDLGKKLKGLEKLDKDNKALKEGEKELKRQVRDNEKRIQELEKIEREYTESLVEINNQKNRIESQEAKIKQLEEAKSKLESEINALKPFKIKSEELEVRNQSLLKENEEKENNITSLKERESQLELDLAKKETALSRFVALQEKLTTELENDVRTFLGQATFSDVEPQSKVLLERIGFLKTADDGENLKKLSNDIEEFVSLTTMIRRARSCLSKDFNQTEVTNALQQVRAMKVPPYNQHIAKQKQELEGLLANYRETYIQAYYFLKDINDYIRAEDATRAIGRYRTMRKIGDENYLFISTQFRKIEETHSLNLEGKRMLLRKID